MCDVSLLVNQSWFPLTDTVWASPLEIMGLVVTGVRRAGSVTGEADTRSDVSAALASTGKNTNLRLHAFYFAWCNSSAPWCWGMKHHKALIWGQGWRRRCRTRRSWVTGMTLYSRTFEQHPQQTIFQQYIDLPKIKYLGHLFHKQASTKMIEYNDANGLKKEK